MITRIVRNGSRWRWSLFCIRFLPDPSDKQRLFVAISTGGVYRTDDGGANWQPRNKGVRAHFYRPTSDIRNGDSASNKIGQSSVSSETNVSAKIIGDFTAATTVATPGPISRTVCRRILVLH